MLSYKKEIIIHIKKIKNSLFGVLHVACYM